MFSKEAKQKLAEAISAMRAEAKAFVEAQQYTEHLFGYLSEAESDRHCSSGVPNQSAIAGEVMVDAIRVELMRRARKGWMVETGKEVAQ